MFSGKPSICRVTGVNVLDGALVIEGERTNLVAGTLVSLDASLATLYRGHLDVTRAPSDEGLFKWILALSEKYRKMHIMSSVASPNNVVTTTMVPCDGALINTDFLIDSINGRTNLLQFLLLATSEKDELATLSVLQEEITGEVRRLAARLPGRPLAFLLMGQPLERFSPVLDSASTLAGLAERMNASVADVREKVANLHDINPALGLRGCRSFARFPRLLEALVMGIRSALPDPDTPLQLMLPLSTTSQEVAQCSALVRSIAPGCSVGGIVQSPRACLRIDAISKQLDFVVFDVLALTELVWACTRVDAEHFLDL